MDWLWIAALSWTAVALPLALLTGIYLRRSDRRQAREESVAAGCPPEDSLAHPSGPRRRARAAGVRATPSFHRATAPPSPRRFRGGESSESERPTQQGQAGARGRSPRYRHR